MTFEIIYIIIFSLMTASLIALKLFRIGRRRRGVVKMITAFMFVSAAAYGAVINQTPYCWLLAAGVFCASMGDLLIIFMEENKRFFHASVISFSCAALISCVYSILVFGWQWWSALVFAALMCVSVICQVKKVYDYGSSVVYLNIYTTLIFALGSLGLSVLCTANSVSAVLFGVGSVMYTASDVCLGLYLYKFRNRYIDAVNTLLYFPGLFLIALSLVFI